MVGILHDALNIRLVRPHRNLLVRREDATGRLLSEPLLLRRPIWEAVGTVAAVGLVDNVGDLGGVDIRVLRRNHRELDRVAHLARARRHRRRHVEYPLVGITRVGRSGSEDDGVVGVGPVHGALDIRLQIRIAQREERRRHRQRQHRLHSGGRKLNLMCRAGDKSRGRFDDL